MKNTINILSAIALLSVSCQKEPVYSDYEDSPIKSIENASIYTPVACSDGSIITVTSEGDTTTYKFVKIDKKAETTSTEFTMSWNLETNNRFNQNNGNSSNQEENKENNNNNNPSPEETNSTKVDISSGKITKNVNDEFFIEYYSANSFGRTYFAVIKFDKDCNKIFQIDSIVSMAGGNMMDQKKTTNRVPTNGTPLDNGGYAMILQTPNQGMMQTSSYNLTLRYINSNGEWVSENELQFSETINILEVISVNNNVFIYYENENSQYYLKIFDLNGNEIKSSQIDYYPLTCSRIGDYAYISASSSSQSIIIKTDSEGNEIYRNDESYIAESIYLNVTELNGNICFSGVNISGSSSINSLNDLLSRLSSLSGSILILTEDGELVTNVTMDYDDGVACFATFKDSDSGYNVYLTKVTNQTVTNLSTSTNTTVGSVVYVYNVPNLENLQIN